jgi:hypothetical protein
MGSFPMRPGVVNNLMELSGRGRTLLRGQIRITPKVNRVQNEIHGFACLGEFVWSSRGEHLNGLASITNKDSTDRRQIVELHNRIFREALAQIVSQPSLARLGGTPQRTVGPPAPAASAAARGRDGFLRPACGHGIARKPGRALRENDTQSLAGRGPGQYVSSSMTRLCAWCSLDRTPARWG